MSSGYGLAPIFGNKQLPWAVMTQFTDVYMHHEALVSLL